MLLFSDFELETPLEELDKEELNKARNIKESTYKKYKVMLTKNQIKDFATIHHLNEEIVTVSDFKNLKKKKHYLLFLTKTQIQKIEKAAKHKETFDLKISKTQMKKTGKTVVGLNDLLEEVAKQENKKQKRNKMKTLKLGHLTFQRKTKKKYKKH